MAAVGPARDVGRAYDDRAPFAPAREDPLIQRAVPVTRDVRGYRTANAGRDCLAGLTVAALAVPSAMAYGELAGAPAIAGLYTILLPCVAYLLLGSSRQVVVGPGGSLSATVAAAILPLAAGAAASTKAGQLAAVMALLTGAWYLLARLLRLGFVADYLSRAVLVGYMHGVVVVVIV